MHSKLLSFGSIDFLESLEIKKRWSRWVHPTPVPFLLFSFCESNLQELAKKTVEVVFFYAISFGNSKSCQSLIHWHDYDQYGSTGCQVFKRGIQNYKDFSLKIKIQKGNYWISRIGLTGRCQKVTKFDFQSQFSM